MSIRVAIIDDKSVNRTTVRDKLSRYPEFEIVIEAKNGEEFLLLLKELPDARKPNVALVDLEMPVMNGIQAIALASAASPDTKFIVLTVFEDNDKIFEAIQAGAHGYLLKDEKAINITEAISQVLEYNGMPMSPVIARKAMEMLRQSRIPSNAEEVAQWTPLSDRELDILKELATGKSYKAIGEKLFISPFTVRKHVSNIYTKLHVDSRIKVIDVARKNRWV